MDTKITAPRTAGSGDGDVDSYHAAQEELRKNEAQFRLLVQAVTDYALYMLSPEGIVTNWNAGAERIKGYSAAEIVGRNFSQFYTEEDRLQGMPQKALDIAAREGRYEKEGWRLRRDGTRFFAHVIIDPIRAPDGTLTGFAKVTRDITERRKTEETLAKAREALFQSQKMDAVGQLTGGVAHDFNNLLMAVLGSLELLQRRLPDNDAKAHRLLDNAIQGARRGASLTQRMLAFARRQELDVQEFDLMALVNGMGDLLERSIGGAVSIEHRLPAKLPLVTGDRNQIELALLNLVVNARDAMPDGGIVTIAAHEEKAGLKNERDLKPGSYVCLSVSDTGEGMSAETLARATEPFFTTKGVGKGTGLGLSMVHGMTEQLGGKLFLKSKAGQGTTVEIWLPAAEPGARPAEALGPAEAQAPEARSLTVLAVDDDALVLFNTTAMLEDLHHIALEAPSGMAALQILRSQKVDLVVTDQAMPKMTGLQLAETIRQEWPGLPVVLATGYAEVPGGVELPVTKLSKPFTEKELAQAIALATRP